MKKLMLISIPVLIAGCSTPPKYASAPETQPEVVISRIDNLEERPKWIKESSPFIANDEKVTSLGSAEIPGDGNIQSGYRICYNNSKAHIATAIEQRLEYAFQQSSENTGLDSTTAQFIGSEASSLTTNSIRQSNQYFEKVAVSTDAGSRRTVYRIFCMVEMPTSDFRRHLSAAIDKARGDGKVSPDFRKKLDRQWSRFIEGDQSKNAREPSNSESAE